MATPSTDVSCASSSSQESSRPNANVLSSFGVGGSSRQSYFPYSVLRSDLNNNGSNGISSEQTRTAAVTAIANTLQQRDGRPLRGDSPYIPSSLSMLFSDPEVMQQEALGSAGLHDPQEQPSVLPRQFSRSRRPFRSRDHGQEDSDLSCVDASYSDEYEDEDEDVDEAQKLIRSKDRRGGYGYEIVQDEPIFSYAAMIREEYIAPHEPSSSSPLFPSPLTTLGRFAPGAILVPTDDQGQNGRTWQDYGTMDNYRSNNEPPTTPLHQSHAAYYHAVTNYMYPSYDENTLGNSEEGGSRSGSYGINRCVPTQYAIPGHDRRASQGSSSNNNNGRRRERRSDDDNWLWGILLSGMKRTSIVNISVLALLRKPCGVLLWLLLLSMNK
ncbi:hypothetical protein BG000_005345 [Podila horticola]|nr:hypothetical protein BG000_005345 [Podila horticola]